LAPHDEATGEKPAKFADAAFAALKVDSASGKGAPADVTPGNIATLNANVANHVSHSSTSHAAPLAVPTPMQDKAWAGDLGQKIVWMANNNKQSAQLTLNPPQMGPIEISLTVEKGHAAASFFSANAEVRDAIETALPRLREMFASAGIELGQTNVGAESFKQQPGYGEQNRSTSQGGGDNAILAGNVQDPLPSRAFSGQQGNGMVDIFA
jgi:flagellar hook-length control protein FliK